MTNTEQFYSFELWKPGVKMNFQSLRHLADNRVFSHIMTYKIAGSGLKCHHLELANKRKAGGIYVLFTEEHVGAVRVTR